ncbi:unnamed protein product [Calypogeia fissa]
MKIDDGALNRYLIKNLQPLTEADPSLLANYVAALLKNNKPKKELQKLCVDQLYDFLGDGTKPFVAKLFQSLEDGTVPQSAEEMEAGKAIESGLVITSNTDVVELRSSPPHLERLPSTRSFGEGEDDSTDDEDDDRNHKHRRRVSRSRSFDRDGEDEVDRGLYRKRGRAIDNGQILRENDRQGNERRVAVHVLHNERDGLGKFDGRLGRDHGSGRFNTDGGQRGGTRSGPQFRDGPGARFDGPNGMMRGNVGRGRGIALAWPPHDQRFPPPSFPDGPEFAPPLLPPGPGTGFFPGRGIPGRGSPHAPWPGFGPLPGLGNGPLEHSHPLSGGIGGGRGPPPISAGMGMSMNINMGRPRCLDFEERGYCLRGDLCPMEHGANRIVVEDVQSLSKFNLPVSLPSGRSLGGGSASGPSSGPMPPPGLGLVNRTSHGSRETSLSAIGEDTALMNGAIPGNGGAEPDSYDPDQPLWNKDRSEPSSGLRTLSSFKKRSQDQEWEGDAVDKLEIREGSEGTEAGTGRLVRLGANMNGGSQTAEGGPSVWDRIGPVVPILSRLDGGLRSSAPADLLHGGKPVRKDGADEVVTRVRGPWQGKWNREVESEEESGPRGSSGTSATHGRGRGSSQGDAGAGQRSGEGTSYGSRGTGGRGSTGFGTERAQRTLYVSFIPPSSNRTEQLLAHFQKFGEVLDIRIPTHSDRAFVQFARREDAEAALTAPDAVIGNRFIRLSWANRDSIPDPADGGTSKPASRAIKPTSGILAGFPLPITKASEKATVATMNGSSSAPVDSSTAEAPGKPFAANGLSSTTPSAGVAVKKQEELARMREEIRKKQEALAQKRDNFRRKLDELAKQGPGENAEAEQPAKRQRLEDAEDSASALRKTTSQSTTQTVSPSTAPSELSLSSATPARTNSGEGLNKTVAAVTVQPSQPSPRSGRMPHARINNPGIAYVSPMARGPARFKLDNRTTVFRVLPPFPASLTDIGVLKDHFAMFGDLATVEVDDAEGVKLEGSTKLSETTTVRVTFATRRAAERAFVQGRWLQGQNLQLVWVNSPSTPTSAVARAESIAEKPSLANQKSISVLPSTEQEGINGSRPLDEVITGPVQEVLVADGNALWEEGGVIGGADNKPSKTPQNSDWRRDSAASKAGRGNVASGPTESAIESPLESESAGVANLSS